MGRRQVEGEEASLILQTPCLDNASPIRLAHWGAEMCPITPMMGCTLAKKTRSTIDILPSNGYTTPINSAGS